MALIEIDKMELKYEQHCCTKEYHTIARCASPSPQGLSPPECSKPPSRLVPASSVLLFQEYCAGQLYAMISSCLIGIKWEMVDKYLKYHQR
jgi:hypothetical protein